MHEWNTTVKTAVASEEIECKANDSGTNKQRVGPDIVPRDDLGPCHIYIGAAGQWCL